MPEGGGVTRDRTSIRHATNTGPERRTAGPWRAHETHVPGDRLHPATLRFGSAGTEAAWRQHDNHSSLGRIRLTLGLALALYALFAWLDLAVAPEVAFQIGGIRIAVCSFIL